jgi:hypothetical protein
VSYIDPQRSASNQGGIRTDGTDAGGGRTEVEDGELRQLSQELRLAIETALAGGLTGLAVALDTARNDLDDVIDERAPPRRTRVEVVRARARLALEAWRNLRH